MTVGLGEAVLILAVYVLAVMRLTRLINFDAVLDRPRIAFARLTEGAADFVTCPWCVGMWMSLATAWIPIWHAHNVVAQYGGIVLAASMLIGLLAPLSADEEVEVVDQPADEHANGA